MATVCLFVACQKTNKTSTTPVVIPPTPVVAPVITSISPTTGPGTTKVTIYGTEFGTTTTAGMVTLNGDTVSIISVSPDSIVVTIPYGSSTGPVKVNINGVTATGPTFTYIPTYVVSTLAGNGVYSYRDGPGDSAEFNFPKGLAIDGQGNLYVADWGNNSIRKITPDGMVSTLIGADVLGTNSGLTSVAVDASGNIFVGLYKGVYSNVTNYVYMFTPQLVSSIAASSGEMISAGVRLRLASIQGIAAAPGGTSVYVADSYYNQIDVITYSSFGTSASVASGTDSANYSIYDNPQDVAVNAQGVYYVADGGHGQIDEGTLVLAGSSVAGYKDGTGSAAQFAYPQGIALDSKGNIYVSDAVNSNIRMITPAGVVTTIAGIYAFGAPGGFLDGPGTSAEFSDPTGIAVDAKGNIYVVDQYNCRIRKISIQ